jgi:hypothetical protein
MGGLTRTAIQNGIEHQVMQEPQPLGRHILREKIGAARVADSGGEAGKVQAGPELH